MAIFTCTCNSTWVSRRGGVSQWNKAFGESIVVACKYWHENFLPIHFTQEAYTRYDNPASEATYQPGFTGYAGRNLSYTEWKEKLFHHRNPLMFTGEAKSDTTASPTFRYRKEQGTNKIVAECTFGIGYADRRKGIRFDKGIKKESVEITVNQMREEFTVVSLDEAEQMAKVVENELETQINKVMI